MLTHISSTSTNPLELLPPGENELEPGPSQVVLGWVRVTAQSGATTTGVRIIVLDRAEVAYTDITMAFPPLNGARMTASLVFPTPQFYNVKHNEPGEHGLLYIQGLVLGGSGSIIDISAGWSTQ